MDALDRWIPRGCALIAFALGAVLAPITGAADRALAAVGATLTGPPLPAALARVAQALPVGDPAYRAHLAQAAVAAALAWLAARIVLDAGRGDRATSGAAIAAGLLAAAGPACGAADLAGAVEATAVLVVIATGLRVWRGDGAAYGLTGAFAAGLALGHGAAAIGATLALTVLLVRRLRAGARWALAAPAACMLGWLCAIAPIAARGTPIGATLAGLTGDHALGRAPAALAALATVGGDDLGPLGAAAALAGVLVLAIDRRYRWLAAAVVTTALADVAAAATAGASAAVPTTTAALAAIATGAAIDRLARQTRFAAGQLAIAATCAVVIAVPAGLAAAARADTPAVAAR